jgi:hypothetical protein
MAACFQVIRERNRLYYNIAQADDVPSPLTPILGHPGAGKTTLPNAPLRDASAGRIAVVITAFGDVGLDHFLIVATTERNVPLTSGCICCQVRGDPSAAHERPAEGARHSRADRPQRYPEEIEARRANPLATTQRPSSPKLR